MEVLNIETKKIQINDTKLHEDPIFIQCLD